MKRMADKKMKQVDNLGKKIEAGKRKIEILERIRHNLVDTWLVKGFEDFIENTNTYLITNRLETQDAIDSQDYDKITEFARYSLPSNRGTTREYFEGAVNFEIEQLLKGQSRFSDQFGGSHLLDQLYAMKKELQATPYIDRD